MIVRQFLHTHPAVAASYLIGCGGEGVAAVIDPVEAPSFYLPLAEAAGVRLRYVIDTHLHAEAGATYPFHGVRDGDRLELGNVTADVWHVPGHTPEHLALVIYDRTRSADPWLVVTGHTLMVGDMGRTELATSAEAGAEALFVSAERLRTLPDYVQILPGAFAGSLCGRGLSAAPTSTVGFERRFNRAFAITERDAFVRYMLTDIPAPPPGAAQTRAANLGSATVEVRRGGAPC